MTHDKYLLIRPLGPVSLYYGGDQNGFPFWVPTAEQAKFISKEEAEKIGLMVLETSNLACEIIGPYV